EPDRARGLLEDVWRPLLALGLPICVGTMLLADELAVTLFGPAFAEAGTVIRVLILSALPLFWVNLANHAVIAGDRVWSLAAIYGVGLGLNVAGTFVLAPILGAAGAAIATAACGSIHLILVGSLVRG